MHVKKVLELKWLTFQKRAVGLKKPKRISKRSIKLSSHLAGNFHNNSRTKKKESSFESFEKERFIPSSSPIEIPEIPEIDAHTEIEEIEPPVAQPYKELNVEIIR